MATRARRVAALFLGFGILCLLHKVSQAFYNQVTAMITAISFTVISALLLPTRLQLEVRGKADRLGRLAALGCGGGRGIGGSCFQRLLRQICAKIKIRDRRPARFVQGGSRLMRTLSATLERFRAGRVMMRLDARLRANNNQAPQRVCQAREHFRATD